MPYALRETRGFTLLEMMLALALFAVGTVAAMDLLHRGQTATTDGENTLLALSLARRCQEALRNVAYASLAGQANTVCTVPSGASFSRFTRTVTVTPMTSTSPYNTANLTQVDVQIAWPTQGASGTTNVTLSALRCAN
jgi:prepilin-type N-terminal cleavage/methylation domain-containing protein